MTISNLYITFTYRLIIYKYLYYFKITNDSVFIHFIVMTKLLQVLRFMPPMCVTKADVDFTIAVLRRAMQNYYEAKYRNNL